ncbi:MAG: crossover junction endodeoxyribonuclease RuvC [Clostridiales bacterium]|nr:crossover junction endodeoxyribonuclease RuvC [Clostridiales bacterium]
MRILGIDPGLATVGYGVVDEDAGALRLVNYGIVTTPAGMPLPSRLQAIFADVQTLISSYRPDAVAVEELFFRRNVSTALTVGHARGAVLVAAMSSLDAGRLYEYTPMQVKQAVCGYGGADKQQVQHMVRVLLAMDREPRPDDAADALAVAICHANGRLLADNTIR